MHFQTELQPAELIKRYKRFLADCRLADGRQITAHCPNPGSMMGLAAPGTRVWLEPNDDPRKKLKWGLRLVEIGEAMVCVDTSIANRVVGEALRAGTLPGFGTYCDVRAEVAYGHRARADFMLDGPEGQTFLEVKSVTLSRAPGLAEFPDSVTARGTKHLNTLAGVVAGGQRAAMLYLVQRTDALAVRLADDIDPAYATAHAAASAAGVETHVLAAQISPQAITVDRELPFRAGDH